MMEPNVNIKRIRRRLPPPVIDLSELISILVMEEERSRLLAKLTLAQVTIMALTSVLTKQRGEFPGRPCALLIIWNQSGRHWFSQTMHAFVQAFFYARFLLHSGFAAADPSCHRAAHCSSQGHVERQTSMGYGLQTLKESIPHACRRLKHGCRCVYVLHTCRTRVMLLDQSADLTSTFGVQTNTIT